MQIKKMCEGKLCSFIKSFGNFLGGLSPDCSSGTSRPPKADGAKSGTAKSRIDGGAAPNLLKNSG